MSVENSSLNQCKRCGSCCKKGGPALHHIDISLIEKGYIAPAHLVTLRKGELAYHPVEHSLIELQSEMIKIKGNEADWTCGFYEKKGKSCLIYAHRPVECEKFACWDTSEIEGLFLKDLLRREDIIPKQSSLFEVVAAYDEKLPPQLVFSLLMEKKEHDLVSLSEFDRRFRSKVGENYGLSQEEMDFFLGRPIARLIEQYRSLV